PQVATQIVERKFPGVSLLCLGNVRYGFFPDVGGSAGRIPRRQTKIDFDINGMKLRKFLSTGLRYGLKGNKPPPILW
ncbi:MAG: hypothetical protein ACP5O1_13015, partial [Phycisphaerae bacterium]